MSEGRFELYTYLHTIQALSLYEGIAGRSPISSETTALYQNDLAMRNTADTL
jgi:hypothetical protein